MLDKLKEKITNLPESPGVYIFKDTGGKIIYIGKAKSLKKRVQSYFSRQLSSKTQAMVAKIADLKYIPTSSEAQAQILEAALVKEKQPQYNISLKDDKSFPWIKITDEEFPIVSIVRRKVKQGNDTARYFGPYTRPALLRQAFKVLRRSFGFRSCRKLPRLPCLYYRLKLCPAPCIGQINSRDYAELIKEIEMFLSSRYSELLRRLSTKMQEAAEKERFEEAAKIRDQINALAAIGQDRAGFTSVDELEDLKNLLHLKTLPRRIEAFDISNISGKEACGSMVSFYNGSADKNNYRRFRIKTIVGVDDYGMLREVVRRRYSRIIKENLTLPDLIIIDGGRAHLLSAAREIKQLGLDLELVSIAKAAENIYIQTKIKPVNLKSDTPGLNLIRKVRDEAHRFALAYHHLLRKKKTFKK